ncbi:TrbG/VirB9 family P-type conjugative transfer protein [Marinicella sp. W31]|uniref:TrbG/VirB9 family P-type conjugative transfer protein n=1 Tax=Marinicella sp. W31 TaxID=3023713 RepID=UPI00375848C6
MKKLITLFMITLAMTALAENGLKDHPNDLRIKLVVYKENDVIPVNASVKTATFIDLGKGNEIVDIVAGDSASWKVVTTADETGIIMKPMWPDAATNLIVTTFDKRYIFDLNSNSKSKTYAIEFTYPDDELSKLKKTISERKSKSVNYDMGVKALDPESINLGYVLKGSKKTAPINIFDNGTFTYLDFGNKDLPAIFSVDEDRNEQVINYHPSGNYIVLQNVYKQLTFRSGNTSTGVFNKNYDEQLLTSIEEVE